MSLTSYRTALMRVVLARDGFAPSSFGLWAQRATWLLYLASKGGSGIRTTRPQGLWTLRAVLTALSRVDVLVLPPSQSSCFLRRHFSYWFKIMFVTIFGRNFLYPHHPSFDVAAAVLPLTGMFEAYLVELFFLEFLFLIIFVGNTLPFWSWIWILD